MDYHMQGKKMTIFVFKIDLSGKNKYISDLHSKNCFETPPMGRFSNVFLYNTGAILGQNRIRHPEPSGSQSTI
jgi:hypothetical protein